MLKPLSYKVLIKDEIIENKTAGGIILDSAQIDREQTGSVFGEIVDMGPRAFTAREVTYYEGLALATVDDFGGLKPTAGMRVAFIRNAGTRYVMRDGELRSISEDYLAKEGEKEFYRLLNDIDIVALAPKEEV